MRCLWLESYEFIVVARHPARQVLPDRPRGSPGYLDTCCPRHLSLAACHFRLWSDARDWARGLLKGTSFCGDRQLATPWLERRFCPETALRNRDRPRLATTLSGDGERGLEQLTLLSVLLCKLLCP